MVAIVRIGDFSVDGTSSVRIPFEAIASFGTLTDSVTIEFAGSLVQSIAKIREAVIAWAATKSITLSPSEVWIAGLTDEQVTGVRKAADDATQSTSFSDVPGLSFQLAANSHYKFEFDGAYTAAAGTTGLQLSVNGPTNPNFIRFTGQIFTAAGTILSGAGGAYDAAIAATASGGATPLPFRVVGSISTGNTAGAFSLRFRTEINNSAVTILRGSIGTLTAVR